MHRLFGVVLGVSLVVALAAVSAAGAARGVTPAGDAALHNFKPTVEPLGISNAPVDYIVQLAGDPVTVQDANSQDNGKGPLTKSQKQAAKDKLKGQQAPVVQQIQQLGGTVVGQFQSAYNGVAVRIAAKEGNALAQISGVTAVYRSSIYHYVPTNVNSVPLIGGPQTWGGTPGYTGTGMKIGDIDTGIDYTHADFGGSGNPADYQTALASDTLPANPAWFGPSAPKVKGGIDLVGDDYDATPTDPGYQPIPHPDPNPLDCNSHGTHTAGTAAGFGVLADGTTYTGSYDANTIANNSWNVGPGVAPQADLYAIRVFGCNGSVDDAVLLQAMEWAVDNGMDAVNMSLGAPFGDATTPTAEAATNAAKDGVIVIAASGNEGPAPYMTGSPASGAGVVSVAANDSTKSFPGADLSLTKSDTTDGGSLTAIDANGEDIPAGSFPLAVIPATANDASLGDSDTISFGCSVADDQAAGDVTGKVIVVERGSCARVAKAIFGQQAGAAAVIMVNNAAGFPPYEGKITSDPDNGDQYTVTIPFLGVPGGPTPSASDAGQQLLAADGGSLTMTAADLDNPSFEALASFSSFGPRSGDSGVKPQVTAPGVSVDSAGMGTGTEALIDSGTSMATPHVTGEAALVKQAHPDWKKVAYWEAAIVNTGDASGVSDYSTIGAGTGLVSAYDATHTDVVALTDKNGNTLDYGLYQSDKDFSQKLHVTLKNFGSAPATFSVADALHQGPGSVSVSPSSVTVKGRSEKDVAVQLSVPIATSGDAYSFNEVAGLVRFTPASGSNDGVALSVPYQLVPAASSDVQINGVDEKHLKTGSDTATLKNNHGAAEGVADWFAWGLKDKRDKQLASDDLLAAGIQSFPDQPAPDGNGTGWLLFAIQTAHPWSNPAADEFDVLVDVNGDGNPDYDVAAVDYGALTQGDNNGEDVVAVFDLNNGGGDIEYLAGANFNGTTMELPVDFAQLGGIAAGTPISYTVESFGLTDGTQDDLGTATATYDLFHPVFSNNFEDVVDPNATASDPISVDLAQWQVTPQLGLLVLAQNNVRDHHQEAFTFPAKLTH